MSDEEVPSSSSSVSTIEKLGEDEREPAASPAPAAPAPNGESTQEASVSAATTQSPRSQTDSSRRSRTNPMNVNIPSNWAAKWTPEEDERLIAAIKTYGENNWKQIAEAVGTRDATKCMQRWDKGLRPGIVKGRWTEEEDRNLVYLVSQGHKNWGKVAEHMSGRTSKQCRERWNNYLDPTLVHTPFTPEEDEMLISLQVQHGNKWAHIARMLPGRTENAVKLRFNSIMQRGPNSRKSISAGESNSNNKSNSSNSSSSNSSSSSSSSSSASNNGSAVAAAAQEAAQSSANVVPPVAAFSTAARGLPFAAPVPPTAPLENEGNATDDKEKAKRSSEDNTGKERKKRSRTDTSSIFSSAQPVTNPLNLLSSLAPHSVLQQNALSQYSALNAFSMGQIPISPFFPLQLQGLQGLQGLQNLQNNALLNPIANAEFFQQQLRQRQLNAMGAPMTFNSATPAPINASPSEIGQDDIEEEELSDSEEEN